MAFPRSERKPDGISLRDAYSAIRTWYQENTDNPLISNDVYGRASVALMRALPPASELADVEIVAVFREVIAGRLEWAFHQSDGRYKMAAYASAALEKLERSHFLTDEETEEIRASILWPLIDRGAC